MCRDVYGVGFCMVFGVNINTDRNHHYLYVAARATKNPQPIIVRADARIFFTRAAIPSPHFPAWLLESPQDPQIFQGILYLTTVSTVFPENPVHAAKCYQHSSGVLGGKGNTHRDRENFAKAD